MCCNRVFYVTLRLSLVLCCVYVVRMFSCVVLRRVVCCTRCTARVLAGLILDGRPIHAHGRRPSSTDTLDSLGALLGAKRDAIPSRPERKNVHS